MMKRIISILLSALLITGAICGVHAVGVVAADEAPEAVTPADPQALAGQLMDEVSDLAHPYVFYSKDEIPALREKVKSGISQKAYELLSASAPAFSEMSLTVEEGANGVIGRQLQHYVSYVAMYSAIADRPDLAKNVINLVISCVQQGSVDVYTSINDALCVGDFGHAYALAYDMLYEYMTEDQRTLVRAEMEEIGEWLFVNSSRLNTWGGNSNYRKAWNWNAVTHGALGMIALSLGDHEDWLALAIKRMESYYQYAVDSTGAPFEGLHYIGYAFNSWAPMGHAIYRHSGVEVMDAYPQMQLMPYWAMYMNAPHEGEQAQINQGSNIGNYASPFYIINRYKQSDALWGWLHANKLFGDDQFGAEYQGNGWSAPQIILYEDPSIEPVAPTEEKNPLIKSFEKGLVIAKDSWDHRAAMMTFTCGYGQTNCWNHPDDNSFTFFAKGESFVIDIGPRGANSEDHNVVLIDGEGMHYSAGGTMIRGIMKENTLLEDGNLYLRGSNLSSYTRLKASVRHLVFGGGETPFVLIFDYVKKDENQHVYSTNFFTASGNTLKIDESGRFATITGSRNQEVCYVIPYAVGEQVSLHVGKASAPAITTENKSSVHLQATLFITANPDGSMPQAEFSSENEEVTVRVTRTEGGEMKTETYVFKLDELVSPGAYVAPTETEPTETTEPEPTETAEPESWDTTETETSAETVPETEKATESETVTESEGTAESENATEAPKSEGSSGCSSSIGAAVLPATAIGAAILVAKKKKKLN